MFEIVALVRVHVLHEKLELVMQLHVKNTKSMVAAWSFIVTVLALVRLSSLLDTKSRSAWRTTALVHTAEAVYYTYLAFFTESAPVARVIALAGSPVLTAHIPLLVVYAGILANAAIFLYQWATTPAVNARVKKQ